jgi:hypothetical protein
MIRLSLAALLLVCWPAIASGPATPDWMELPIRFEPNVGQASGDVRFLARGAGYTLLFSGRQSQYVFHSGEHRTAIEMTLVGARDPADVKAGEPQRSVTNYVFGSDPRK